MRNVYMEISHWKSLRNIHVEISQIENGNGKYHMSNVYVEISPGRNVSEISK